MRARGPSEPGSSQPTEPADSAERRAEHAEPTVEDIKAQAEEWVAETHRGFVEARSKLDAELESARVQRAELEHRLVEAEARATELERAQQALRRRAEEAEATVEQLEAQAEERAARHAQALAEAQSTLEAERSARAESPPRTSDRTRRETQAGRAEKQAGGRKQSDRTSNWTRVRRLAAEGHSQREIARRLGINRRTVARLIAAEEPPRYRRRPQGSMLDPLEPVMRSVLQDRPGIDAPGMTQILRKQGYRGSVDLVRRRLNALRRASEPEGPSTVT